MKRYLMKVMDKNMAFCYIDADIKELKGDDVGTIEPCDFCGEVTK